MVTGANRGIGLELVTRMSSLDTEVVIACSRTMSAELEELVKVQENVHHFPLEITSQESVDAAFESISALLGGKGINVLINNAAILIQSDCVSTTSSESYTEAFNVNVVGTHRVTMKFAPLLYQAAEQCSDNEIGCNRAFCLNVSTAVGSIANTSSPFHSAYRVSKAGLNMLTKCMALEFIEKGVLCCGVHPGWVQTNMGGPNALISAGTCVDDLMEVLTKATKDHNGLLLRNKLEVMPF